LKKKIKKKILQKYEAREKKQLLLEEIREKYGYNISLRDAKVKEFLEEKALFDKKKKKQLSKEQKAEKALKYIQKFQEKEHLNSQEEKEQEDQ
jgi:hypothetical protein